MRTIILGAGFAGMAAGIKTGHRIFEASHEAGGICGTYMRDGFMFSTGGGHWIFGDGPGLDFIKSRIKIDTYQRKAGVYLNTTIPYPIQTFLESAYPYNESSFKGWNRNKFSNAVCNLFMTPFNEKYTCGLYDKIIQMDGYKTPPVGGKGFVPVFHDPTNGLSELVNNMAKDCDITYNKRAVKIDVKEHVIFFEDGTIEDYDRLISTIPLNRALDLVGIPSGSLPYTSVMVLNIGAKPGKRFPKEHWLYVPFCKSGFYRLGFYSNINKNKAPEGMVSLSAEMAFLRSPDQEELDNICDNIIEELQDWQFIGDVITSDPTWVDVAYTWNFDERDRLQALELLKKHDIESIGRYGRWLFCGMVESIQMGLEVEP